MPAASQQILHMWGKRGRRAQERRPWVEGQWLGRAAGLREWTLQYQGGWGLQSREHGFLAPHLPPPPAGSHSLSPYPGPAPPPCTRRLPASRPRVSQMCSSAWWSQRKREEGRGARAAPELAVSFLTLHPWGHFVPAIPCDRTNGQTPLAGIEGTGQEGRGPLLGTDFRSWDTQRTQDPWGREKTQRRPSQLLQRERPDSLW